MLHKAPEEKLTWLITIFNELPADFQDSNWINFLNLGKIRKINKENIK